LGCLYRDQFLEEGKGKQGRGEVWIGTARKGLGSIINKELNNERSIYFSTRQKAIQEAQSPSKEHKEIPS